LPQSVTDLHRPLSHSSFTFQVKQGDTRENQKREWSIEVLRRLGWTQAEIGEAVGLKQPAIAKQLFQIPDSVKGIKTQLAKSGQINAIAEAYNMPLVLATALDLGAGVARV